MRHTHDIECLSISNDPLDGDKCSAWEWNIQYVGATNISQVDIWEVR